MLEILYCDAEIVVLVKPVGLISEDGDAGESVFPAIAEALAARGERDTALYPIHRLDRNVGGVMVFARTARAAARLSEDVRQGKLCKTYLALVHGAPLEKSGIYRDLLFKDVRKNKSFVVSKHRKGVREAVLDYETLVSLGDRSLVRVNLYTGRSHQIRVQFAHRRTPLVGDGKYGAADNEKTLGLFSYRLAFSHPESGEALAFSALPQDGLFADCIAAAGISDFTKK
mgnify:CR=1 FL=1